MIAQSNYESVYVWVWKAKEVDRCLSTGRQGDRA